MNINVQIERLVLDGIAVSAAQRPHLQAALEAELGRLLTEGGLAPSLARGAALPSVVAPGIQLSPTGGPGHLGQQIAYAVYRGIGR
jgi:hypothetical protein